MGFQYSKMYVNFPVNQVNSLIKPMKLGNYAILINWYI